MLLLVLYQVSNSQAFVFQAPSNQDQASGSVSHCGENGVSNSSAYWSSDVCSADCSGSWYAGYLLDKCSVCDTDTANDCTQDCNGDWGGPDNIKDNGDEAYNDHCNVCDAMTQQMTVLYYRYHHLVQIKQLFLMYLIMILVDLNWFYQVLH